jgi:hypothetical protein
VRFGQQYFLFFIYLFVAVVVMWIVDEQWMSYVMDDRAMQWEHVRRANRNKKFARILKQKIWVVSRSPHEKREDLKRP